jgi:hypothetical protein
MCSTSLRQKQRKKEGKKKSKQEKRKEEKFLLKPNGLIKKFGFTILKGNSSLGPRSSPCQEPCFFHLSKLEDELIFLRRGE